jgi:hypothetical protein
MYGTDNGASAVTVAAGTAGSFSFTPADFSMTADGVYYFKLHRDSDATESGVELIYIGAKKLRAVTFPLGSTPPDKTVSITWDDGAGGAITDNVTLMYGASSGVYPVTIAAGSTGSFSFTPASIGMSTAGAYYFRLSNAASAVLSYEYSMYAGSGNGLVFDKVNLKPNPFSPKLGGLKIRYRVDSDSGSAVKVRIRAYTLDGKYIAEILRPEPRQAGLEHEEVWDGKDAGGKKAKNGRYIIQLEAEDSFGRVQDLQTAVLVE